MARLSSLKLEYPESRIPDWFIWKFEIERERERENKTQIDPKTCSKEAHLYPSSPMVGPQKVDHFLSENVRNDATESFFAF